MNNKTPALLPAIAGVFVFASYLDAWPTSRGTTSTA